VWARGADQHREAGRRCSRVHLLQHLPKTACPR
jgi:hypothetical protein